MSIDEAFNHFFKPEIQTSGRKLFADEKVSISTASDIAIQAFVRVSPPVRVRLSADSVGSPSLVADCSCLVAKKGQFCKHVWAALLGAEIRCPDFLSEKREIHLPSGEVGATPSALSPRIAAAAERQAEFKAAAKVRAAEYRKQQYQKQKARKGATDGQSALAKDAYAPEIESALTYFKLNGFEMPKGPDAAIVREAKKVLSRVFHPDRGGTNAEVAELNHYCDLVLRASQV